MKIVSVYGTAMRVHYLFCLLLFCFTICGQLREAVVIFGCVLFHELCHTAAARWFGYRVSEIVLLPFGGVAKIDGMKNCGWQELAVVLSGPVGSALCAGICWWGMTDDKTMLRLMAETHTMLALWNLVPAYPLDGGRVIRILFGHMMTQKEAVKRTASISYVVAAVLIFYVTYEWFCFGKAGISLLIMAGMIVRLSAEERRYLEMLPLYVAASNQSIIAERGHAPIEWYAVRADMRAGDVIALFRPQTYTMIRVLLRSGEEYGELSETMIWRGLETHLLSEAIRNFCERKE